MIKAARIILLLTLVVLILASVIASTKMAEMYALTNDIIVDPSQLKPKRLYYRGSLMPGTSSTEKPGMYGNTDKCPDFPLVVYKEVENVNCVKDCDLPVDSDAVCKREGDAFYKTCTMQIKIEPTGTGRACPTASVKKEKCQPQAPLCVDINKINDFDKYYTFATTSTTGMQILNTYINNSIPVEGQPFVMRHPQSNTFLAASSSAGGKAIFVSNKTSATPFILEFITLPDKTKSTVQFRLVSANNRNLVMQPRDCADNNTNVDISAPKTNACGRSGYGYQYPAWAMKKVSNMGGQTGYQLVHVQNNNFKVHPYKGSASNGTEVVIYAGDGPQTVFDWQYA